MMHATSGSQPASERGSARISRCGRHSVCCWTSSARGQVAAHPGSTAAQETAKWGARGVCAPQPSPAGDYPPAPLGPVDHYLGLAR
jgi:hypothetical protein